ncbi:MAG: enoyl-CoA hydratase/isomerase family protein [Bacteroidota bacterium]|nr:enoyl-CoA hydratase/isomerase family protein [Bacteroidota bacterium]
MNYTRLLYSVGERICTITLNRPEKRNALDDEFVQELTHAFVAASKDAAAKVVILEANGNVFCAGADLDYLQRMSSYNFEENLEDSKNLMRLFQTMYSMRKPIIAKVQGPAIAGGCGLATACDIVVASEEATFGYTEVKIGFIPAIVLTFLVRRIGEGKARNLVLRGEIISAREAKELGLVNEAVTSAKLSQEVQTIAESLCKNSSLTSMGLIKEMFANVDGKTLSDMLDYAANVNAVTRMSEDCRKGIAAFLNKEKIGW